MAGSACALRGVAALCQQGVMWWSPLVVPARNAGGTGGGSRSPGGVRSHHEGCAYDTGSMEPLDRLGRPLRDLRISVTDRCNFRCTYCMPREVFDSNYQFLPHAEIL